MCEVGEAEGSDGGGVRKSKKDSISKRKPIPCNSAPDELLLFLDQDRGAGGT